MAIYTLRNLSTNEEFDVSMSVEAFRKSERNTDDHILYNDEWHEVLIHSSKGFAPAWGGWGFRSDAMGVNPTQIKEQKESDRKHGVTGVDYDRRTGEAIYESRSARAKHLKAYGFYNKQAFSGRV